MAYPTVASLISDAAAEMGLITADIVDPYASMDQNIVQLLRLLKSGGVAINKHRDWTHLRKEYTFATVNGTESYALPADFKSLLPNSGWNRSTSFPLGGPVGSDYWQFRKAVPVASTIVFMIRIWRGQMFFSPIPGSAQTIAYEYESTSWAGVAAAILPNGNTKDAPTLKDDVIFFDQLLMLTRLKLDFRKEKRFDTVSEQDAYDDALYAAESEDSPGSMIYLGGRSNGTPRKLDRWNLPDTGAGQ